jgi:hypothetical protein
MIGRCRPERRSRTSIEAVEDRQEGGTPPGEDAQC